MAEQQAEEKQFNDDREKQQLDENGLDGEIDAVEQARILRKVDWNLLPIITLLYLMSFLDRTNIGNAKIEGLVKDLGMTPGQYNIALSILFASYVSFEVPSNIFLKRLRPSRWLPGICFAWGLVATLTGIVQNFGGLVAVRLVLGFLEAGLFPGVVFLLTLWYPRHATLFRFSLFFSAATLAGAFGGLLARGLIELKGRGGLEGWRWIFIVEGIITCAVAVLAVFLIRDEPASADFLTRDEKIKLEEILRRDSYGERRDFDWKEVGRAFTEWKVWLSGIICIGIALPTFSFALFLPTIITGLGYSSTRSQLLTVPPYAAAFISTISIGYLSDRSRIRTPYLLSFTIIGAAGYILQLALPAHQPGAKYFGTFLAAISIFTCSSLNITWLANNLRGYTRRAVGSAVQVAIGQLGGLAGSYIYQARDAPSYYLGHGIALGFLVMAFGATVLQYALLSSANRRLDAKGAAVDGYRFTL